MVERVQHLVLKQAEAEARHNHKEHASLHTHCEQDEQWDEATEQPAGVDPRREEDEEQVVAPFRVESTAATKEVVVHDRVIPAEHLHSDESRALPLVACKSMKRVLDEVGIHKRTKQDEGGTAPLQPTHEDRSHRDDGAQNIDREQQKQVPAPIVLRGKLGADTVTVHHERLDVTHSGARVER